MKMNVNHTPWTQLFIKFLFCFKSADKELTPNVQPSLRIVEVKFFSHSEVRIDTS